MLTFLSHIIWYILRLDFAYSLQEELATLVKRSVTVLKF